MGLDEEHLVIANGKYNRSYSPQHDILRNLLMKGYGTEDCLIATSGMSAISAVLYTIVTQHTITGKPIHIVYSEELYCDTPRLCKYIQSSFPTLVTLHTVDVRKPEQIVNLYGKELKGKDSVLLVESCSNPNGYIFDFSILPKLKSSAATVQVVIDNTWLTEIVFNPFQFKEVDYVVVSLTKYYGAGVAIAGAVLGNADKVRPASDWTRVTGIHVSPHHCKLIANNYETIKQRITSSSALTQKVVKFMAEQPKIKSVSYPLTNNHPSYNLATKYFNKGLQQYGPSVFTFRVQGNRNKVLKIMKASKLIDHKTSFGAKKTRTDPWPESDGDCVVCRIAVGSDDDYERVVKGLQDLLSRL
jgi:cystathionine beta-lyase/cystathionine gamma-synthase